MKATEAGMVIGQALEAWDANSATDRVMVIVKNIYNDPSTIAASSQNPDDYEIVNGINGYDVQNSVTGDVVTQFGAFDKAYIAELSTGRIDASEIVLSGMDLASSITGFDTSITGLNDSLASLNTGLTSVQNQLNALANIPDWQVTIEDRVGSLENLINNGSSTPWQGDLVMDSNANIRMSTGQKLILDDNDSADSYLTHDALLDRISLYIDGDEKFRFGIGGNESDGTISTTAFDLAETYPTDDSTIEAGDVVVISDKTEEDGANYLVSKSDASNKEKVIGVVSSKPGFQLGGSSFYSDFCSLVNSGEAGETKAREQAKDQMDKEKDQFNTSFDETIATDEARLENISSVTDEAIEDKIASCKALRQVPIALSGRVPVKIDVSEGDIKAGDLLAVSEKEPGKAVRATKAGWIVGRALENSTPTKATVMMFTKLTWFSGREVAQTNDIAPSKASIDIEEVLETTNTEDGNLTTLFGDFNVLGDATVNNLTSLGKISAGLLSLDGQTNSINVIAGKALKLQDKLGAGNIEAFGGKLVMTTDGSLVSEGTITAKKVVAEEYAVLGEKTLVEKSQVTTDVTDATVGEGTIKAGSTEVTIQNLHVTPAVKIFVTANTDTNGQGLVVKDKKTGLFKVSLKNKLTTDVKFDYWIVKVE